MTDIVERLHETATTADYGPDRETAKAAADEIERLRAAMQWRPIETAPRDGTEFIAYRPDAGVFTAGYDDEQDVWFASHGYEDITDDLPTRWMPLPLPPSGEQSDDR